jgi:hypothetical protein
VQIEGMASRTVEHDAGPLLGGIVPKTEKLLQLPDGGYGADTRVWSRKDWSAYWHNKCWLLYIHL